MSTATACANIALVKYWGKRSKALNLPAAGSLSITLDALRTRTTVELSPSLEADELELDGQPASEKARARASRFLDLVRKPDAPRARVVTSNAFPAASGLASSASGFAALAVAAADAYGLDADASALSALARRGSGSAARSIFGGFARMDRGVREDGQDAVARPIASKVELGAVIAVARAGEKEIGSTEGMDRTTATSPYHASWLAQVDRDLAAAETALAQADLDTLRTIVEGSCLAMHADAMAARPGIIYFAGVTLWAIQQIRALQRQGVPVMFTIDAGPHVVALAPPQHLDQIEAALTNGHPDLDRLIKSKAGEGAHLT